MVYISSQNGLFNDIYSSGGFNGCLVAQPLVLLEATIWEPFETEVTGGFHPALASSYSQYLMMGNG
jgi:hypothetical protein